MSQPEARLPLLQQRLLFESWFAKLARDAGLPIGTQRGTSGVDRTIGSPSEFHVTIRPVDRPPWVEVIPSDDDRQDAVKSVWQAAAARVDAGDLGGNVWYSTSVGERERDLGNGRELMRLVGSQTRILGWRRLGARVLLEFHERSEEPGSAAPLFAPIANVDIHVSVPGPTHGEFSHSIASRFIENAAAACTFALARPVGGPPAMSFPSPAEKVPDLERRQQDPELGNLARKGQSLDIWDRLTRLGGFESHSRAGAALRTFDAALRQDRGEVAVILLVSAAECLTVPARPWRKDRLTKRFVDFFDELMPAEVDAIVQHANAEESFGFARGQRPSRALRRDLLERLYQLRSQPLHEGLIATDSGAVMFGDPARGMRRVLAADFTEGAILRYLKSPRSSLIGHPRIRQQDPTDRLPDRRESA